MAAAPTLMDWAMSEKASKMYNEGYAVVSIQHLAKPVKFFPDKIPQAMTDNDFEWAAKNRKHIFKQ